MTKTVAVGCGLFITVKMWYKHFGHVALFRSSTEEFEQMQATAASSQSQDLRIKPARGGLYEKWVKELTQFRRVMGVVLFTTSEGGTILVRQGEGWDLPMSPVNGRDSAPIRIPFTVAKRVLSLKPEALGENHSKLVGEVADDDDLYVIVKAAIPNRLRFDNTLFVKGDTCLAALEGVSSLAMSAIEYARKHHSLSWSARTATVQ